VDVLNSAPEKLDWIIAPQHVTSLPAAILSSIFLYTLYCKV
jgi:hypothetical protein